MYAVFEKIARMQTWQHFVAHALGFTIAGTLIALYRNGADHTSLFKLFLIFLHYSMGNAMISWGVFYHLWKTLPGHSYKASFLAGFAASTLSVALFLLLYRAFTPPAFTAILCSLASNLLVMRLQISTKTAHNLKT